jgi:pilus assembly protein CpaE
MKPEAKLGLKGDCSSPISALALRRRLEVLRAIVICPDVELSGRLTSAAEATGEVAVVRKFDRYPSGIDLVRTLRAHAPEVIFLSFEELEKAQEVVKYLEGEAQSLPIVAIHRNLDARLVRETMRIGVREFLTDPFDRQMLHESLASVKAQVQRKPPVLESTSEIFAFLPSKAGVGTSTIALNVSAAISRRPNTRVLLADFDLNSGMMRFMLKLQNEYSVIDAAEHALEIDESLWPQLVTSFGQMDVLHAGRVNPNLRIEGAQIRGLIDFARRNYQSLCFDLSGNLERYSLEIMQECKRVLLVCTPEIPSLHLAREKIHFLRTLDLDSRVSVVLNRVQKKAVFSTAQVEEILGRPVVKALQNDYHGVNRSLTQGTWIEPASEMGKAFSQFATELLDPRPAVPDPKKQFIQFFAVPTSRALVSKEGLVSKKTLVSKGS